MMISPQAIGWLTFVSRPESLMIEKSFEKFHGRYQDLIEKYQRSVKDMVNDSFTG